jgi:hypothetical protein
MAYRDKKQKHQAGVTPSDMNGLAELLLTAFKGSIKQELDETGQVNPRLLAEAVKWLSQSGVTLSPDNGQVADFSHLTTLLDKMYEADEANHNYI